ncbi:8-oxo-dGTP diphosphatase [Streptococcus sp. CSL10205-OR2]|uniref:8-oxo-dGTP diphosphatase n=1 Tax=Streptococcus sp. CSL10205-OR2 TaxID=2980558 RepID=UPI0021DAAB87|nr:8-oxo-dGTP diphosphatase [Streptococcus sp. CSL10205-OR2]MCU9533775.1 8-oxo-dGTP diphosphatase [Streptococcus sp. CSL10205-OR2]
MSRNQEVILTNMCLIEDDKGNVLVQIRKPEMYRWSGVAFPGGHIEEKESLHDAVVREVLEETGLTIKQPKLVGMKHWYNQDGIRYLVFLYRTNQYEGLVQSSDEGEVKWVKKTELPNMDLAFDLLELLKVFEDDTLSEFFYRPIENGKWQNELY